MANGTAAPLKKLSEDYLWRAFKRRYVCCEGGERMTLAAQSAVSAFRYMFQHKARGGKLLSQNTFGR